MDPLEGILRLDSCATGCTHLVWCSLDPPQTFVLQQVHMILYHIKSRRSHREAFNSVQHPPASRREGPEGGGQAVAPAPKQALA